MTSSHQVILPTDEELADFVYSNIRAYMENEISSFEVSEVKEATKEFVAKYVNLNYQAIQEQLSKEHRVIKS